MLWSKIFRGKQIPATNPESFHLICTHVVAWCVDEIKIQVISIGQVWKMRLSIFKSYTEFHRQCIMNASCTAKPRAQMVCVNFPKLPPVFPSIISNVISLSLCLLLSECPFLRAPYFPFLSSSCVSLSRFLSASSEAPQLAQPKFNKRELLQNWKAWQNQRGWVNFSLKVLIYSIEWLRRKEIFLKNPARIILLLLEDAWVCERERIMSLLWFVPDCHKHESSSGASRISVDISSKYMM